MSDANSGAKRGDEHEDAQSARDDGRALDSQTTVNRGFDLQSRLDQRETHNLRRDLSPTDRVAARARFIDDPRGGEISFDGTDDDPQLVFASNNYLGLSTDKRVQKAARRAARTVGPGAGASRLVTGDTVAHRELEQDLSACKNTERTLVFSSGYAANVGTIAALNPDVIFSDALNHASIIDGCRLAEAETIIYDHADTDSLAAAMEIQAREATGDDEQWLVVTDTVFSMDGDIAPVGEICNIASEYGAWVMVDEAHATGIYGEEGGGVVQREGLSDQVDIQLGTLSKALASQGGYVSGSEALIEHLLNASRSFVFSTGLAPPAAAAGREALRIAREENRAATLWSTVDRMREELRSMGYEIWGETQILPVMIGDRSDALALGDELETDGIIAPAIRPPTVPEGTSRIRVTPMATHTDEEIEHCLAAFERAGSKLGLL